MTIIPLGDALPRRSSHLPADSVGHLKRLPIWCCSA